MDDRRLTVRPFEPQTMSDNAAVAIEDAEIGRAQLAAALEEYLDMRAMLG